MTMTKHEKVYVRALKSHVDNTTEGRPMRTKGVVYILSREVAKRMVRHELVEIIGPIDEVDPPTDEGFTPDMETRTPDGPTDLKDDLATTKPTGEPKDLLEQRGNSPWFDVEGYEDNPVNGRDNALDIAREVLYD